MFRLVELVKVESRDVLDQRVHLLLVLDYLGDVDDLLLLKVLQELLEIIE